MERSIAATAYTMHCNCFGMWTCNGSSGSENSPSSSSVRSGNIAHAATRDVPPSPPSPPPPLRPAARAHARGTHFAMFFSTSAMPTTRDDKIKEEVVLTVREGTWVYNPGCHSIDLASWSTCRSGTVGTGI